MHQPPLYTIGQENLVFIVTILDELLHIDEHPFCSDPECPCKEDEALNRMFINKPLDARLLTGSEAIRLYFGTQLTPTQNDARITNEEIEQIMSEPSPLDENYHRSFFDGLDPDDLDDHPF